ncbi:MAG: methyltransferase [Bacteroidales bacterium]|nr:methyltransferase [Bacteroidales bacterium]MBN2756015.1 methyltransferase [Bacteroidales bacterium]
MSNSYFKFKQFNVNQDKTAMKVGVDSVLLGAWTKVENSKLILDVGTGTGLLSLMLAQKSNAKITSIEINEDAYNQAIENVNNSIWKNRISVINISLQNFVEICKDKFDLIICNPPYFVNSFKSPENSKNTAKHNEELSLNDLFEGVKLLLCEKGKFSLVYPFEQKEMLIKTAENKKLFPVEISKISGNENKKPNRIFVKFSHEKAEVIYSEIYIRDSLSGEYTDEYKKLTKDYYLAF